MYFHDSNAGPPVGGFGTRGPPTEQSWYRTTNQCYIPLFQTSDPSSLGEENFSVYFIFEPKNPPPHRRAILDPRGTI